MRRPHRQPATVVQSPEPPKAKPIRIGPAAFAEFQRFMQEAGPDVPRHQFKVPALPPGVVPAGGSLALDSAGPNFNWLNTQPGWCGLGFPGYTYLSELAQRSEYQAPTQVIADEMTREWIKFTGADEEKIKELTQAFEDFKVREVVRQCLLNDGFFGRGQMYVRIKGQEIPARRAQPLTVDDEGATIRQGSLLGFKSIEPIWSTPYAYNSSDPTADDFYTPEAWYVMGVQTHATRLLPFISCPVPDILKPAYNFSGLSLTQRVEPYVQRWLKTVDSVNRSISNYSTSGLACNMEASLGGDGSGDIFKRAALFNKIRDSRGLMLTDKSSEEFFQFNTPLTGLADLQAQAQEHMAAPTHVPLVKLTGVTPAGLNANSDGEIKVFYDWIGAAQINVANDNVRTCSRIVQLHLWGKVDPDITHEWVPLDSPTDKEESEMRKADGDRDTAYVGAGIVSPDEVRERLRMSPKSGYTHLEGDAPPSPLEQDHELGQAGAEADHERGKETAATGHKNALELAAKEAKNKPKLASK